MKPYGLGLTVLATATAVLCVSTTQSASAAGPVQTVVSGLGGPLHVSLHNGGIYIADTFSGRVLRANPGTGRTTTLAKNINASAVSVGANGRVFAVIGDGGPVVQSLVRLTPSGGQAQVADLLAYEKAHNPDGQPQQTGPKADALSNPYDVLALPNRTLVADAAANDILSVAPDGTVSLVAVLPVSKAGSCAKAVNNGVKNGGCDPVPTGLALGPDGYLYVSGLGAEVEGHVWKIDQSTGRIVKQIDGLPPLTGIAVAADGTVYVSSLFTSTVYRLGASGHPSGTVSVDGPTGLQILGRQLYAGSVVFPPKAAPKGSVVRVPLSAFSAG